MGRVVEVPNVDGPDRNANDGDHLGQLLAELVQLLLQRGFVRLGLGDFRSDFANLRVQPSAKNDAARFAGGDVCALGIFGFLRIFIEKVANREKTVFLVLVDRPRVGHIVQVLDDRHGLARQNGLVNADGGRVDFD